MKVFIYEKKEKSIQEKNKRTCKMHLTFFEYLLKKNVYPNNNIEVKIINH